MRTLAYHFSRMLSKGLLLEEGLILQLVVNTTALEDISLPLVTDAFKGTVLE